MDFDKIIEAVKVFNAAAPAAAGLILKFRHPDGTENVLATLDAAEAQVNENIAAAKALIDSHKPQTE